MVWIFTFLLHYSLEAIELEWRKLFHLYKWWNKQGKIGKIKTPNKKQAPWWGLACHKTKSYGKHVNEKYRNAMHLTRLKKDGMTRAQMLTMVSELHPWSWRIKMDFLPSRVPCGHPYVRQEHTETWESAVFQCAALNFVHLLSPSDDDDELMLNVLRCHETY